MHYLTWIWGTSSIIGTEEDASSNAGASESGRASCGMIDGSFTTFDVCWIERLMLGAEFNQKRKGDCVAWIGEAVVLALLEGRYWIWCDNANVKCLLESDGWTSEIPGLSEMFERRFLGRPPRLYLRQLYLKVPNNMFSKRYITISRRNKSCLLPSERGGVASVGTSASSAAAMVRVRLEEPGVFWIVFLVLVILRFLPAATSARVGAL